MGRSDSNKERARSLDEDRATGMLGLVSRFARQLPGAEFAEEQLHSLESRALRELKQRLEGVDDRRLPPPIGFTPTQSGDAESETGITPPARLMADLMKRAEEQTEEQARWYLYSLILKQLVPDEARLLHTLAEGGAQPLLHLGVGPLLGTPRIVAENFSHLGKTAMLRLKDEAPAYITHLRSLGLLETGPEDKELALKYQILESEKLTREVADRIEQEAGAGRGVRYIRAVLRISPLGQELWDACQP